MILWFEHHGSIYYTIGVCVSITLLITYRFSDLSNVTAIASASGRGTNFVNISKSTFQVGANNSSVKKITEDEIDWEDEEVEGE